MEANVSRKLKFPDAFKTSKKYQPSGEGALAQFIDPSTPSMKKGRDGGKTGKKTGGKKKRELNGKKKRKD